MTDASAPKRGWLQRLTEGLSRSSRQLSDQVVSTFVRRPLDQAALDELEEMLIEADLGPAAAARVTAAFARERFGRESSEPEIKQALAEAVADELKNHEGRFDPLSGPRPYVVLFVGVNGSGKTTTLGKIAADLQRRGAKVLIDTAGRLQNKQALMDELLKVIRAIRKVDPEAPHETLLVLDATVGRNALAQEQVFGRTAMVSGIVMTKLDGTARGGVLVPVANASDAPIKLIGVGEGIDDLQPFNAAAFARSLVGLDAPARAA